MTIIEPNKHIVRINLIFFFVVILIVGGGIASILLYNETVRMKHFIASAEGELQELETHNADSRNELYAMLDAAALQKASVELGFEKEKKPFYLEVVAQDFAIGL